MGEGTAGGARSYYGSADSTPLFLIMLGEALRWGAPREALIELLPAARAAVGWLRGPGDPDEPSHGQRLGLRTLSAAMAGYNPISYHLGSVWPHDTVIACEGLRRYGIDDVAGR